MTGMSDVYLAVGEARELGSHLLTWRYAVAAVVAAGYRLLAEQERRRTLRVLVTQAPAGTVIFVDKGPGGPAMRVQIGERSRDAQRLGVPRGR